MPKTQIKPDTFAIEAGTLARIPEVDMNPAYSGGLLLLPGFECPVVIDLEPLQGVPHDQNISILRNHNPDREIGHTEKITIDGYTVRIEGKLSFDNADVKDIVDTHKLGKKWQVSVGSGAVPASMQQIVPEGDIVTINGQEQTGPIIIVQTPIREVSFVSAGADLHNAVEIHASTLKGEDVIMTFETWAAEKGFNLEGMDETSVESLRKIFEAETVPADEAVEAEGTEKDEDEKDKPVNAGGLRVPRRSNFGTASVGTSHGSQPVRTIEASMLMAGGLDDHQVEKLGYDQRTIDQAVSAGYRGIGIQELFHRVIRAAGMHYIGGRKDNQFIRTAFEASRRLERQGIRAAGVGTAGFSTINLPGILSNVANKTLLNAYQRIESVAMKISRIVTATDFKEMAHYQFQMDGTLEVVPPGGELENVSLSETGYKNKLETRGAIVTLTRQDIINDDLEAFLRIPQEFGRKAGQTLEYVTFKTLFDNLDNLFNDGNANILYRTNLSISGLDAATKVFAEQRDNSGTFILIQPKTLLVPPALAATAKALYTSTTVNETTEAKKPSPVDNPYSGQYVPAASPFMGQAASLGGDDKSFLLLADPLDAAILEIAFLNGVKNPIIESEDAAFNTLGMSWRCYFDFGVAPQDPKGGVYVTETDAP